MPALGAYISGGGWRAYDDIEQDGDAMYWTSKTPGFFHPRFAEEWNWNVGFSIRHTSFLFHSKLRTLTELSDQFNRMIRRFDG